MLGFTNFPHPFRFFLEGRPHTIVWPILCASSHAPKILPFLGLYIAVQPAVYAKYITGSVFEMMASHDTSKNK